MKLDREKLLELAAIMLLAGCSAKPLAHDPEVQEADSICYSWAIDHISEPTVKSALADKILTEGECRSALIPIIKRKNADYRDKQRAAALRALALAGETE